MSEKAECEEKVASGTEQRTSPREEEAPATSTSSAQVSAEVDKESDGAIEEKGEESERNKPQEEEKMAEKDCQLEKTGEQSENAKGKTSVEKEENEKEENPPEENLDQEKGPDGKHGPIVISKWQKSTRDVPIPTVDDFVHSDEKERCMTVLEEHGGKVGWHTPAIGEKCILMDLLLDEMWDGSFEGGLTYKGVAIAKAECDGKACGLVLLKLESRAAYSKQWYSAGQVFSDVAPGTFGQCSSTRGVRHTISHSSVVGYTVRTSKGEELDVLLAESTSKCVLAGKRVNKQLLLETVQVLASDKILDFKYEDGRYIGGRGTPLKEVEEQLKESRRKKGEKLKDIRRLFEEKKEVKVKLKRKGQPLEGNMLNLESIEFGHLGQAAKVQGKKKGKKTADIGGNEESVVQQLTNQFLIERPTTAEVQKFVDDMGQSAPVPVATADGDITFGNVCSGTTSAEGNGGHEKLSESAIAMCVMGALIARDVKLEELRQQEAALMRGKFYEMNRKVDTMKSALDKSLTTNVTVLAELRKAPQETEWQSLTRVATKLLGPAGAARLLKVAENVITEEDKDAKRALEEVGGKKVTEKEPVERSSGLDRSSLKNLPSGASLFVPKYKKSIVVHSADLAQLNEQRKATEQGQNTVGPEEVIFLAEEVGHGDDPDYSSFQYQGDFGWDHKGTQGNWLESELTTVTVTTNESVERGSMSTATQRGSMEVDDGAQLDLAQSKWNSVTPLQLKLTGESSHASGGCDSPATMVWSGETPEDNERQCSKRRNDEIVGHVCDCPIRMGDHHVCCLSIGYKGDSKGKKCFCNYSGRPVLPPVGQLLQIAAQNELRQVFLQACDGGVIFDLKQHLREVTESSISATDAAVFALSTNWPEPLGYILRSAYQAFSFQRRIQSTETAEDVAALMRKSALDFNRHRRDKQKNSKTKTIKIH